MARSADGRFLYLGGRTFAFDSRIVTLEWDAEAGQLAVVQVLGGLPASANEGELLLTPTAATSITAAAASSPASATRATGFLTRKGISSSAAVIDLFFDAERGQLYSIGEEVLHVWQRDPASGALASVGIFDELDLVTPGGAPVRASSGRRLARSTDGRWLYALAFGPALTADPWSLVVFDLQGVPLLAGWGQGGPTGNVFPSALLVDGRDGTLAIALSALPGGTPELAGYRAEAGGRRFGPPVARLQLAAGGRELLLGLLASVEPGELYAGGWDRGHWQRFAFQAGLFSPRATFDGVERLDQPIDLALSADRETLLVAVPAAGAVARLGYRQGQLGFDGSDRFAASRILLLAGGRYGVLLRSDGLALQLFRLQEGQLSVLQTLPLTNATEIAASPDGKLVYAFGTDGAVFRFDAADERLSPFATIPIGGDHAPRISPDGRFLLINQRYAAATFPFFLSDWLEYDPAHGTYRAFDEPGGVQDELVDVAFSPAGEFLYAYKGSLDPRIAVYRRDPQSGAIGELVQEERSVPVATGGFYFDGQLELDADGRFLY